MPAKLSPPDARGFVPPSPGKLEAVCARTGLTRAQIAQRLGITIRMLYYYLSGEHAIPFCEWYCLTQLQK